MREAVHIFLKDSRHLRYAVAAVLVWTVLLGAAGVIQTPGYEIRRWQDSGAVVVMALSQYLLPTGWWFLVARSFHAEALPGTGQFWLTRPYRRGSLLLAKALFVLAYITLPFSIVMVVSAAAHHLPMASTLPVILWVQVLVLIVVILPAAALAAMTSTLTQFVVVAILLPILFTVSQAIGRWGPFEWFRNGVAVTLILAIGIAVLVIQFWSRRTHLSRVIALVGILAAVVILPTLSWRTVFAWQSRLRPWEGPLTATLVPPQPAIPGVIGRPVAIRLFYRVTGAPTDTVFKCEGGEFTVESATGAAWRIEPKDATQSSTIPDGCLYWGFPPESFVDAARQGDVTIRGKVYVTVFGPAVMTSLPDEQRVVVPRVGVCSSKHVPFPPNDPSGRLLAEVRCETPPRAPSVRILIGTATYQRELVPPSYSPFPAELTLGAFKSVFTSADGREPLVVATREPLGHVSVPVEISRVRFLDFY